MLAEVGGGKVLECFCPTRGEAVGSEVWWGHLGGLEEPLLTLLLLTFVQPPEGSKIHSQ